MKEIEFKDLDFNVLKQVRTSGALITAAKPDGSFNTMTIGWMNLGYLWSIPTAYTYVRESRYTYEFMEEANKYTVCFFDEDKHDDLMYLGKVSGRDEDKLAKTSLTPVKEDDVVYYKEASVVIVLEKRSTRLITSDNIPANIMTKYYDPKDYHKEYIGEVVKVLVRD